MNPVTFNEPLLGVFTKNELDVPLVEFRLVQESSYALDERIIDARNRKFLIPFGAFRVSLSYGETLYNVFVTQLSLDKLTSNQSGSALFFCFTVRCYKDCVFIYEVWICKPQPGEARLPNGITIRERLRSKLNSETEFKVRAKGEEVTDYLTGVMRHSVKAICFDFTNPHLFLCKKSPTPPQGKTVNWQKQREHFVFLHKSHTANRKESIGRKVIEDGATVDRAAHSRRAHSRLLSSPKFKHKQGQRVWVKSTWCGPKEWTDRSGQIYKIVEKPEEVFNPKSVR